VICVFFFFFQPEDGIRDFHVTGVQTCALPISQIGSGRALSDQDMVFPTYREHGVAWCRDVDPIKLLGLFRGVSHGGWDPAEHNRSEERRVGKGATSLWLHVCVS